MYGLAAAFLWVGGVGGLLVGALIFIGSIVSRVGLNLIGIASAIGVFISSSLFLGLAALMEKVEEIEKDAKKTQKTILGLHAAMQQATGQNTQPTEPQTPKK